MSPRNKEIADRIEAKAAKFRGEIIQEFTNVELIMNHLIHFSNEGSLNLYHKANMDERKKIFIKKCIIPYEIKYNIDLSKFKEELNFVIDKRHHLAHWAVDITEIGIELYSQKRLRFFCYKFRTDELNSDYFTEEGIEDLKKKVRHLVGQLLIIQNVLLGKFTPTVKLQ